MNDQTGSTNKNTQDNDSVGSLAVQSNNEEVPFQSPLAGGVQENRPAQANTTIITIHPNWARLGKFVLINSITMAFTKGDRYLGTETRNVDEMIHGQEYIESFAKCKVKEWYPNAILASKKCDGI